MEKSIYDVAIKLEVDENFEWDDWSTLMTFGTCAYAVKVVDGEPVCYFVKPYTKEFDDVMFGNFDSKDYVIEEASLQVSSIMDSYNKMLNELREDGKI